MGQGYAMLWGQARMIKLSGHVHVMNSPLMGVGYLSCGMAQPSVCVCVCVEGYN